MPHHHAHAHAHQLVPRQRKELQELEEQMKEFEEKVRDGVATVVSVVFKTMPKTFSGDAVWVTQQQETRTLGEPAVAEPTTTKKADPKTTSEAKETTSARRTSEKESESETSTDKIMKATSSPSSQKAATTLMVATSSPTLTGSILAATGIASSTPSPSASAEASSGMSGGAKAGLALGILIAIALVLGAVLFFYHRKKKQAAAQRAIDDEKMAMRNAPPPPPVVVEPAPSIRTQRTMSTAPRLSLRPVTQFSPTFAENRKSGGNLLNVAAAGAPASHSQDRSLSPENRPRNSWEEPAPVSANNQNPFNDPVSQSNVSPQNPQNPFGNNAAIETPQTTAPSTPIVAAPPAAPSAHMNDYAGPAPAPAPAMAAAVAAPIVAAAAIPVARKESPSPTRETEVMLPPKPLNADAAPPSPAWTDDIPASPGPAPTGPPPIAVAGGSANGPAPVPNNVHRVQLDFKPSMQDELELRAGQLVRMLHEYDDGWALCVKMDRSQQGVVPRTCLSKHPVKPRTGPPRNGPPGPRARGPPVGSPMGPGGVPHPRPLTPSGRSSPHPPSLSPAGGRMSPAPGGRSMSPGPRSMSPSMGPGPHGAPRGRSNSNAPYAGPPRSMSPGPYGGGPQMPPPHMPRPRSNSASQVQARRNSPPGPSPMNPNAAPQAIMPQRKPVPGLAL